MHRPLELLFLQPLQPETETAALPIQNLDLVAPLVREAEQIPAERIEPQRRLDQRREPIDAEPEVNRILRQIDRDIAKRRRRHCRAPLS